MTEEVWDYFSQKYEESPVRVVWGHWPDFKSEKEVDEWIDAMEKVLAVFREDELI